MFQWFEFEFHFRAGYITSRERDQQQKFKQEVRWGQSMCLNQPHFWWEIYSYKFLSCTKKDLGKKCHSSKVSWISNKLPKLFVYWYQRKLLRRIVRERRRKLNGEKHRWLYQIWVLTENYLIGLLLPALHLLFPPLLSPKHWWRVIWIHLNGIFHIPFHHVVAKLYLRRLPVPLFLFQTL